MMKSTERALVLLLAAAIALMVRKVKAFGRSL